MIAPRARLAEIEAKFKRLRSRGPTVPETELMEIARTALDAQEKAEADRHAMFEQLAGAVDAGRALRERADRAEADRDKFRGYFEANAKAHHEVKKERDAALEQAAIADSRYQANLGDRKRLMDERDAANAACQQMERLYRERRDDSARMREALEEIAAGCVFSDYLEYCVDGGHKKAREALAGDGKGGQGSGNRAARRDETGLDEKAAPAMPASAFEPWRMIPHYDCGRMHGPDQPCAPPPAAEGCPGMDKSTAGGRHLVCAWHCAACDGSEFLAACPNADHCPGCRAAKREAPQ